MTTSTLPSVQSLLAKMSTGMGRIPAAIEKSTVDDDRLIRENLFSRMYAMWRRRHARRADPHPDLPRRDACRIQSDAHAAIPCPLKNTE